MEQWLIDHQILIRLAIFILAFGLLALWETLDPFRAWYTNRWQRWFNHVSLSYLSFISIKFIFPALAIGVAIKVQHQHLGVFHQSQMPAVLQIGLAVVVMDFIMYLQHRLFHRFSWLWRVHRVHHIDLNVDVSTALRFHPIEEVISMGVKCLSVAFFGIAPIAVFIYEVSLGLALLYAHLNVRLSHSLEKWLRVVLITPGMHRIHHSDYHLETDSNYGFCLSWWDRLFGTYVPYTQSGERKMIMGLESYRDPKYQTLANMLLIPFNIKRLKIWPRKPKKVKFAP